MKEDDNETEAPKSCEGDPNHEAVKRKKKKKKKKSGKHVNAQRSSEDNADVLHSHYDSRFTPDVDSFQELRFFYQSAVIERENTMTQTKCSQIVFPTCLLH